MSQRPRQIADEMIDAMRRAAGKVWRAHAADVPEEDRADWERLVKRHCGLWFARKWGQGSVNSSDVTN